MLIECGKCKFKDIPGNYSAIKIITLVEDKPVESVFIVCPVCDNIELFHDFSILPGIAISKLLIPAETITDPQKVQEFILSKVKELKSKYLPTYEK